jgi:hypothetical protein
VTLKLRRELLQLDVADVECQQMGIPFHGERNSGVGR